MFVTIRKKSRFIGVRLPFLLLIYIAAAFCVPAVYAQNGPVPSPHYYEGERFLNRSDFTTAAAFYQEELRNATKIGASRWIDSICYYARLGEAHYLSGDYNNALEFFNAAANIYLEYSNWLARVNYPLGIQTFARSPVAWGPGNRNTPVSKFPGDAMIILGDNMTEERLRQGGAISQMRQIRINPLEILECMALSVRRRNDILGPLTKYDPLSRRIVTAFSTRAVPPNHWSIPWLDVLFGLALEGTGKIPEALNILKDSLLIAGRADHSLTSTALLAMGKLSLQTGKSAEAISCFYEASLSAYQYGNFSVVEESLRCYSNAQKAFVHPSGPDGAAGAAILLHAQQWSKSQSDLHLLQVSLNLELAESFIEEKNFKYATSGLQLIDRMMNNRGLRTSRYADRWNYLNALLAFGTGQTAAGDLFMSKVVEGMKMRSPWFFQIMMLDRLSRAGGFTSSGAINLRGASELYQYLLREPTGIDQAYQPMDSIAVQLAVPPEVFQRWFTLLIERDQREEALLLAERMRRERFYSRFVLGRRLVSLRYLLTAPPESLIIPDESLLPNAVTPADPPVVNPAGNAGGNAADNAAGNAGGNAAGNAGGNAGGNAAGIPVGAPGGQAPVGQAPPMMTRRQDILLEYPDFAVMAKQTKELYVKLQSMPLVPTTDDEKKFQRVAYTKILENSAVQESQLRYIAAGRTAVPTTFPPLRKVAGIQQALPKETSLLSFIEADGFFYGFMITRDILDVWRVGPSNTIGKSVAAYLKLLGNADGNRPIESRDLFLSKSDSDQKNSPDRWRKEGKKLLENLLGDHRTEGKRFSVVFKHLIVVPDGVLWYLPFETLSVPTKSAGNELPLLEIPGLTVRYAATAGLALPGTIGRDTMAPLTVVSGSFHSQMTEKMQTEALNRLAANVSKMEILPEESFNVPSGILAPRLRHLAVFSEIAGVRDGGLGWTPYLANKLGNNSISQWGQLPWGAPRLLLLPGFRSAAENSLKGGSENGSEFFFSIMTLQSTGAETLLMSRWRTGGRSAFELMGLFLKNFSKMPAAEAWKAAVEEEFKADFVYGEEPRLRKTGKSDIMPKVTHPLFWGGYMLVDRGEAAVPVPTTQSVADPVEPDSEKQTPDKPTSDKPTSEEPEPKEQGAAATDSVVKPDVKPAGVKPVITTEEQTTEKPSESSSGKPAAEPAKSESPAVSVPKKEETTPASPEVKKSPVKRKKGPITDKDLEEADKEADDFYSPEK